MRAEVAPSQRHLVGLSMRFSDSELRTKYVFPFVDAAWSVPFCTVDGMGRAPQVFAGAVELRDGAFVTKEPISALTTIASLPLTRFDEVVHFDPWRTFRGIAGVDRAYVEAILASNIAGSFNHEGSTYKLHDLEFDPEFKNVTALVAKDPVFRSVTFHKGDVDLILLRKPPRK